MATYTWDRDDRLRTVTLATGEVVKHTYDADSNRVRTEITPAGGTPTAIDYLVDPTGPLSHVIAEIDDSGAFAATYVRAGDELLATLRPSGARYVHADGLGSIRLLTDTAGAVTDSYTFSAFGELLEHTGSDPNAYLFAGEPLDPNSGFYHLRARWLDPQSGRFLSIDPFAGSFADPPSLHRYLYAHADPANRVDPTGRFTSISESLAVIAVRVTVFTMRHPYFSAAIGLAFNLVIPAEFSDAIAQAAGPAGAPLSAVNRGRARFFQLVKGFRFREFIKRHRREAGKLWNEVGKGFESFLEKLLPQAEVQRRVGAGRSVDFYLRRTLIEAKTGTTLGKRELKQLDQIARHARDNNLSFTYQFLNKPGPSVINKIEELGGTVLWIFDNP